MAAAVIIATIIAIVVVAFLLLGVLVYILRWKKEPPKKAVDHTALAKRWFVWNPNQDLLPETARQVPAAHLQSVVVTKPGDNRSAGQLRSPGLPTGASNLAPGGQSLPVLLPRADFAVPGSQPLPIRTGSLDLSGEDVSSKGPVSGQKASFEKERSSSSNATTYKQPSVLPESLDWLASRSFTLREVLVATDYFNQKFELGSGGFGKVYQGQLKDGTVVAIKRMKKESKQGMREFINEVRLLGRLRHVHLVQLVGFCATQEEQLLVYEYMSNGNLAQHLRGSKMPLSWRMRLEVAIGAAKALDYLHVIATPPVIHRDVKSSNILLDEDWNAKVADFGLSKAVQTNTSQPASSTFVRGTPGYFDPEYYEGQRLTEKSDVYAFGVVLLEMMTGKKPIDDTLSSADGSLAKWARPYLRDPERALSIADSRIKGSMTRASVLKFASLALNCIALTGDDRPSMSEVVLRLRDAIAS